MADRKITDLTALAAGSQATGDLLTIVDVSEAAATDKNKKITVESLFKGIPGDVGIGTTSPAAPLEVVGTTNGDQLRITQSGQHYRIGREGSGGLLEFYGAQSGYNGFIFGGANGERLRIDSSGRVGIGTSSPGSQLNLSGPTANTHGIQLNASGWPYTNRIGVNGTSGADLIISQNWNAAANTVDSASYGTTFIRGNTANGSLAFGTGPSNTVPTTKLFINNSGNVGVGNTSPSKVLTIANADPVIRLEDTNGGAVNLDANASSFVIDADPTNATGSTTIQFKLDGAERARLDSSGRLLVGTSSAGSSLTNTIELAGAGTSSNQPAYQIYAYPGSSNANTGYFQFHRSGSATLGTNVAVGGNDRLGMLRWSGADGTNYITAAEIYAEVDGTPGTNDMPGRLVFSTTADGASSPTERLRITSTGAWAIEGASNYGTSGQVLTSNGNDSPTWQDAAGGSSDSISEGNTSVECVDTGSDGHITFDTEGSERMRLDSSGRLSVGTSSADSNTRLHVSAAENTSDPMATDASIVIANTQNAGNNEAAALKFNLGNTNTASISAHYDSFSSGVNSSLRFYTQKQSGFNSPREALRIDSNGHVEIKANSSGDIRFQLNSTGTRIHSTTAGGHIDVYTNSAVRNRFLYNGQGTEFSNQSRVIPTTDNAVDLGNSGGRWTAIYAVNGTIQTSDSRLKHEVETSVLGIDFVKALRPVSYKWIEGKKVPIVDGTDENGENIYRTDDDGNWVYESRDGARKHWGFIAQEVKQAVDDANVDFAGWTLADKDDPDSTQSLRYDEFIAPLTKALQEAIAKIETLETQNADLLARVTALEAG